MSQMMSPDQIHASVLRVGGDGGIAACAARNVSQTQGAGAPKTQVTAIAKRSDG